MGLAIRSLPILLLELERDHFSYADRLVLDVINIVVLVAFAVDYGDEFTLASDPRAYARAEWVNAVIGVTSVLAILPRLARDREHRH